MTYVVSHQDWTIAYGYLFRHPERSRPTGGVAEGPLHVAKATEQVPRLRLAEPVPSEVEGLGSGRDDGSFWSYAIAPRQGRAIAYERFRRLDRSAKRAERRNLFSTIGRLSLRKGLSARPCGPRSRRRGVATCDSPASQREGRHHFHSCRQ